MSESSENPNKRRGGREELRRPASETEDFNKGLIALMPKHFKRAMYLTHQNQAAAEDIVQETMLNALRNKDKFKAGTDLAAWTRRILENAHNDWRRRNFHTRSLTREREGEAEAIVEDVASPEDQGAALDMRRLLEKTLKVIDKLPPHQKQAIVLTAMEDSGKEVGGKMGVGSGTVKTHVFRAREKLKNKLQDDDLNILR